MHFVKSVWLLSGQDGRPWLFMYCTRCNKIFVFVFDQDVGDVTKDRSDGRPVWLEMPRQQRHRCISITPPLGRTQKRRTDRILPETIFFALPLVQVMIWCRIGNKPLSEPMMPSLLGIYALPRLCDMTYLRRASNTGLRYPELNKCFVWFIDLRSAQVYCVAIFLVSQEVSLNFHRFCG